MADTGAVAPVDASVQALPIVMMVGGVGLVLYAAYLHYVALPEEQTRKHVIIRGCLVAAGFLLMLIGVASMH
jgi:hypothetical protein